MGWTDVEAETPILWPSDVKNWFIWKGPDAGKDWGQKEKGMTEDETVGWHNRLNGHEFEWTPGVGDGQGGLVCCSPWGRKESDMTEQLNWTELNSVAARLSVYMKFFQYLNLISPLSILSIFPIIKMFSQIMLLLKKILNNILLFILSFYL